MIQSAAWAGPAILAVFGAAYALVFAEEKIHLRKSKPVMVAGGLIWILVALAFYAEGRAHEAGERVRHVMLEYAELFLFLLSAMGFVNTMVERNVFESLRTRLSATRLSSRGIFWITGLGAFFLSPIADNLTTALVMGSVIIAMGGHDKKFITCALINIVVAANAGGAFSPFGDITTLMVWQKGVVAFGNFFSLFLPSLVNWLVPAVILSIAIKKETPTGYDAIIEVRKGGIVVVGLFLATIAVTVVLNHSLHLPPFVGMMFGLGVLNIYGYFLNDVETRMLSNSAVSPNAVLGPDPKWALRRPFDIYGIMEKIEWDTMLFFYGVMLCVGGLDTIGYLSGLSQLLYSDLGPTIANTALGLLSSLVGNIPLTFIVLTMNPAMDLGQWLLVTLTAGVGGSLLSIGSAAGVALMGIAKDKYTFMSHLKWSWAILLGYAASIATHMLINHGLFTK